MKELSGCDPPVHYALGKAGSRLTQVQQTTPRIYVDIPVKPETTALSLYF